MQDKNFDDLFDRFRNNIYQDNKGRIRLAILWSHMMEQVALLLGDRPLRVLDVGCGPGLVSLRLAQQGHELVLCDVSEKMLNHARREFEQAGLMDQASFHHGAFQELGQERLGCFDLVICHAVVEWLAEPRVAIKSLANLVGSDGVVSLMFYNRHSIVFRNAIRGNFRKAMSENFSGDQGGLTPMHPQNPADVERWLNESNLSVTAKAGIRVFYDYMAKDVKEQRSLEDIIQLEKQFCFQEPYLQMARYLHFVCQKPC